MIIIYLGEERIVAATNLVEDSDDSNLVCDIGIGGEMNHMELHVIPPAVDGMLGRRMPVTLF